jgi:hypothetical protein
MKAPYDAIGSVGEPGHRLVAPVGMVMGGQDDSGAHAAVMQRGMRTDKLLHVLFVGGGYVNGRAGLWIVHT